MPPATGHPARKSPEEYSAPREGSFRRADWTAIVCGAILAAGAIAAYGRTFSVPLVFDDIPSIADNPSIRHWGTAIWPPIDTVACGRPILNLSFALNWAIGGASVWSYHVANLAIHVLAGLTLLGILRRTLLPRRIPKANLIAFSAALLWTLHPLHTGAVTYISQRAESLMGLFYLLTVYCFIRCAQACSGPPHGTGRNSWAALSVLACLLGMATKEVMASAPLIVLLYDRTFLAGTFREAWRRRWMVHMGLAATWLILIILVPFTRGRNGTVGFGGGVSWWSYALTQFPTILRYLKLSAWPHPLVFDYGTEWAAASWATLSPAVVVIGLAAAAAWAFFRPGFLERSLGFAGAWFFAILAPSSLIPNLRQTAAEYRMYLALIPLVVLCTIGIYRWLGRAALTVSLALGAFLLALTAQRNEQYRSALTLWSDTVAVSPANPWAHTNLGVALEKIPGRLNEAIAQYEEAIRLKPNYADAHSNLGGALERIPGRLSEAIAQCQAALRLKPDYADAHNNLGAALEQVPGRLNDAIAQYEEALRLNPNMAEAHVNLGKALNVEGRTMEVISEYEAALRLYPNMAEVHNNLGNALNAAGRTGEAITQYEEALRLNPSMAEAHSNLGVTLAKLPGRLNDAIAQLEEALRLRPDVAELHLRIAIVLLNSPGRRDEARAHLETVLRLQPGNDSARQILAGIRAP
jgi:tetratricopeptide (TPR) repeat protein